MKENNLKKVIELLTPYREVPKCPIMELTERDAEVRAALSKVWPLVGELVDNGERKPFDFAGEPVSARLLYNGWLQLDYADGLRQELKPDVVVRGLLCWAEDCSK